MGKQAQKPPTFVGAWLTARKRKREPLAPVQVEKTTLAAKPDASIPPLPGERSEELLDNVHRGLRTEVYFTLGPLSAWPAEQDDPFEKLIEQMACYESDHPNVVQTYVYLCAYNKKELDETAFTQLERLFTCMRDHGWTMLLRFAYEYDAEKLIGPTASMRLRHIEQLKEWFAAHEALFRDTVTAFQLGLFGPWGEGGQSQHPGKRGETYRAACGMVPEGTYVQARVMEIHAWTRGLPNEDRIGYHNDFMVGKAHEWNTAAHIGEYETFRSTVRSRLNDGEMPWGRAKPDADEIEGLALITQCAEHRLTTLSLTHNYKEPDPGAPFRMAQWQREAVTAAQLDACGAPYDPAWFCTQAGEPLARTIFDYLRDYLGYRLALSNLRMKREDGATEISLLLTNYGLAAPFLLDTAELVVERPDGGRDAFLLGGFLPRHLHTRGQQNLTAAFAGEAARLGVRIGRGLCSVPETRWIRLANAVPYGDGIHWIWTAEKQEPSS